jgi:DnaJ-like protein
MHDAGAAVVAAQLLAFYREPVRYRPRLTHGRETFSGGLLVFRFAQGRFPQGLMRDLSPARREHLREAAAFFIRQVCFWEGASHYQVLCVAPGARRETIKEHYHGLMALIHPDRQDAGSRHWPAQSAHRVNMAYQVLADDAQRRAYDAKLQRAAVDSATREEIFMEAPGLEPNPVFHKVRRGRLARIRRSALLMSAGVASLFFIQVWWAGEVPGEYSAIPSAAPLELSLRWMREAYSSAEQPLRKALSIHPSEGGGLSEAAASPRAAPIAPAHTERPARPKPAEQAAPPAAEVERAVPERPAQDRSQDESAAKPPSPRPAAPGIAQASLERRPPGHALSTEQMEGLVARVVTHYESGDVDKLLALYDPAGVGVWEAIRLRNDFQDFFDATRTRRLRLRQVSWDTMTPVAHVKGAAKLVAQYHDEPIVQERDIQIELDVVSRDGQPRISRLSLFPHVK